VLFLHASTINQVNKHNNGLAPVEDNHHQQGCSTAEAQTTWHNRTVACHCAWLSQWELWSDDQSGHCYEFPSIYSAWWFVINAASCAITTAIVTTKQNVQLLTKCSAPRWGFRSHLERVSSVQLNNGALSHLRGLARGDCQGFTREPLHRRLNAPNQSTRTRTHPTTIVGCRQQRERLHWQRDERRGWKFKVYSIEVYDQ